MTTRGLGQSAVRLAQGDCLDVLRLLPESSVDAVVTDPPYGLSFMGQAWDTFDPSTLPERVGRRDGNGPPSDSRDGRTKGRTTSAFANGAGEAGTYDFSARGMRGFQQWSEAWAREAFRVLAPGGYLVVFAGTRTYHRMVCGVEDAGFEIRDQLAWLFGSGFPKGQACLKPAHEPILLARRPSGYSTPLNIDACRLAAGEPDGPTRDRTEEASADARYAEHGRDFHAAPGPRGGDERGRWPANVVLDQEAAEQLDQQSGVLKSGANPTRRGSDKFRDVYGDFKGQEGCEAARGADEGGASRFYYVAKPDNAERHAGLGEGAGLFAPDGTPDRNDHPTVKPVDLMRWLCRLVAPAGGTVLDPFLGSGTTGIAAALEGLSFIGIEREPAYLAIARARIAHWAPGVPAFDLDTRTRGQRWVRSSASRTTDRRGVA